MRTTLHTMLAPEDGDTLRLVQSLEQYTGIRSAVSDGKIFEDTGNEVPVVLISDSVVRGWGLEARANLFRRAVAGRFKLIIVAERDGSTSATTGRMSFSSEQEDASILKELSGTVLPVTVDGTISMGKPLAGLDWGCRSLIRLEAPSSPGADLLRMYRQAVGEVFVLLPADCVLVTKDPTHVQFARVLPLLVCIKHHFGDRCWHRRINHANLTIDDPWLREPYGFVSYFKLLERMKDAHFHTTIAFVPWNYDRNRRNVVELFRRNPEYYSIAPHGNNHDRFEFRGYDEVPLREQVEDVRQAGLRMELFKELTQIPYDKVMIFPQYISPEPTIEVLKENNYLASANGTTIPLGARMKSVMEHSLMPAVSEYFGFPLLKRYHPTIDKSIVNIILYLQRPILFYIHHYYFDESVGAFDAVARYTNLRSQTELRWGGLSGVSEGLFLERSSGEHSREVRMLSRKIRITRDGDGPVSYRIDPSALQLGACEQVIINENVYGGDALKNGILEGPHQMPEQGDLCVEIVLAAGNGRYAHDTRRRSIGINAIRLLCDFRDNTVYRNRFLRRVLIR